MGLQDSCLYCYECNDDAANTTVTDATGTDNGVCSANTDTISDTGKIGNAFHFNITESVGGLADLSSISAGSFSVRINVDNYSAGRYIAGYLTSGSDDGEFYWLVRNTGYITFMNETAAGGQTNIESNSNISTGSWYHVVVTWGTGGMAMYVNGTKQSDTDARAISLCNSELTYKYFDTRIESGYSYYKLIQIDIDGEEDTYGPVYVYRNVFTDPKKYNLMGQEVNQFYKGLIIDEDGRIKYND